MVRWIQILVENRLHHPPAVIPQSFFLRRYGWIHRAYGYIIPSCYSCLVTISHHIPTYNKLNPHFTWLRPHHKPH